MKILQENKRIIKELYRCSLVISDINNWTVYTKSNINFYQSIQQ